MVQYSTDDVKKRLKLFASGEDGTIDDISLGLSHLDEKIASATDTKSIIFCLHVQSI